MGTSSQYRSFKPMDMVDPHSMGIRIHGVKMNAVPDPPHHCYYPIQAHFNICPPLCPAIRSIYNMMTHTASQTIGDPDLDFCFTLFCLFLASLSFPTFRRGGKRNEFRDISLTPYLLPAQYPSRISLLFCKCYVCVEGGMM